MHPKQHSVTVCHLSIATADDPRYFLLALCRHEPEIRWCELTALQQGVGTQISAPSGPLVLALCSDGVWDNWRFEDVSQFALHPGRVEFALRHESAQACCVDLMQANLERARVNFGSSADNMTAVLAYLVPQRHRLQALEAQITQAPGGQGSLATSVMGTGTAIPTPVGTGTTVNG